MKISIRQLLVTFLSHFFIFVGFGHSVGFLGLSIFFINSFKKGSGLAELVLFRAETLPALGLLALIGYLLLGIAGLFGRQWRNGLYVAAIFFLYFSLIYLWLPRDGFQMIYSHPAFSFPFLLLSMLPLYKNGLLRFWERFNT